MATSPVLNSQCVPLFLRELRKRKVAIEGLREKYGLEAEVEKLAEARLALARVPAFADDCARLAKDPFFGLHVGWGLERGTYGLLEFAVRSAPTVRASMLQIHRYSALLN